MSGQATSVKTPFTLQNTVPSEAADAESADQNFQTQTEVETSTATPTKSKKKQRPGILTPIATKKKGGKRRSRRSKTSNSSDQNNVQDDDDKSCETENEMLKFQDRLIYNPEDVMDKEVQARMIEYVQELVYQREAYTEALNVWVDRGMLTLERWTDLEGRFHQTQCDINFFTELLSSQGVTLQYEM